MLLDPHFREDSIVLFMEFCIFYLTRKWHADDVSQRLSHHFVAHSHVDAVLSEHPHEYCRTQREEYSCKRMEG